MICVLYSVLSLIFFPCLDYNLMLKDNNVAFCISFKRVEIIYMIFVSQHSYGNKKKIH